jgi:hypothetical protein
MQLPTNLALNRGLCSTSGRVTLGVQSTSNWKYGEKLCEEASGTWLEIEGGKRKPWRNRKK